MDYDDTTRHPRPLLPPSFIVRSGGGFHLYWLLDGFYEPAIIEEVNKTLIAHDPPGEGGAACWERTRILRVPGTKNTKYDPPRDVLILTAKPDRVYTPDELLKLDEYDRDVLEVRSGETRSERDWRLASLLFSWDLPPAMVKLSLLVYSEKAKEEGEHYLDRTVAQAAESPYVEKLKADADVAKVLKSAGGAPRAKRAAPVANFAITPLARLVGPGGEEAGLQLLIAWESGNPTELRSVELTANQRDFESRRTVNQWLAKNRLGSRAWLGTDKTAYQAWAGMVEAAPHKEVLLVKQAGRYDLPLDRRVFVYGQSAALTHGTDDPENLGVAWTPQAFVPLSVAVDPTGELEADAIGTIIELTLAAHAPEVLLPALGWIAATPLKPVIETLHNMRFPLLMLFGPKGSGKTTLLRSVLLPLTGMVTDPLGADVSRFALLAHLGQYNAQPAWIGEFRSGGQQVAELQQYLRMAYDGGRAERGRPDQSVAVYDLTAPIVVDGEALFTDAALRERCIALRLRQDTIKAGTPAYVAHEHITSIDRKARATLAARYLQHTLEYGAKELSPMLASLRDSLTADLPFGRLVNTASIVALGLAVFGSFAEKECGLVLPESRDAILAAMGNTYAPGLGVTTPIDQYCEVVAHAYADGQAWARSSCLWDSDARVLWFNVTMTLHWVRRFWSALPDRELVLPQLEDRSGLYITGPERLSEKGGGTYWGIEIDKAQELGLDIPAPLDLRPAEE
jgi:hypothetical protein